MRTQIALLRIHMLFAIHPLLHSIFRRAHSVADMSLSNYDSVYQYHLLQPIEDRLVGILHYLQPDLKDGRLSLVIHELESVWKRTK